MTADPFDTLQFDAHGKLVDVTDYGPTYHGEPPQPPKPVNVLDVIPVTGRRLVVMTSHGPVYGLIAAGEVEADLTGLFVRAVEDWRWHAWNTSTDPAKPPRCPRAVSYPTLNVWVER
jgi:hypothetical protein